MYFCQLHCEPIKSLKLYYEAGMVCEMEKLLGLPIIVVGHSLICASTDPMPYMVLRTLFHVFQE